MAVPQNGRHTEESCCASDSVAAFTQALKEQAILSPPAVQLLPEYVGITSAEIKNKMTNDDVKLYKSNCVLIFDLHLLSLWR